MSSPTSRISISSGGGAQRKDGDNIGDMVSRKRSKGKESELSDETGRSGGKKNVSIDVGNASNQIRAHKVSHTHSLSKAKSLQRNIQFDNQRKQKEATRRQIVKKKIAKKQVSLFQHLAQYEQPTSVSLSVKITESIHPAIACLGLKYANKQIVGSNARCLALLDVLREVIKDYNGEDENLAGSTAYRPLALSLEAHLRPLIQYLSDCRPLSIGMGNAIKDIKRAVGRTSLMDSAEAKRYLIEHVDAYKEQKIILADNHIVANCVTKIQPNSVILTFGSSHIVENIITHSHASGIPFRVIIVDSGPRDEGKTLLRRLVKKEVECSYVKLTALSYVIGKVTLVLLGAHAMLSNGSVISRVGTAIVAMMANSFRIPVLVPCETYKFHERVQLDAMCYNELGDPDDIADCEELRDWQSQENLKLLNLAYDVTPMGYVSGVVTEMGIIPPTSVPVVIREAQKQREGLEA